MKDNQKLFIENCIKDIEKKLENFNNSDPFEQMAFIQSNNDLFDIIIQISKVFSNEIPNIAENLFLKNDSAERDAKYLIEQLKWYLAQDESKLSPDLSKDTNNCSIFLSHSSSDKKYGDIIRNLIIDLGVQDNQLVYTSHALHKIPLDQSVYKYLRNSISFNFLTLILWSNDYLEKPACLSEMGATWVLLGEHINLYTPDFNFYNPKYVDCPTEIKRMGIVLNGDETCSIGLIELKNKIAGFFNLNTEEKRTTHLITTAAKKLREYLK